MKRRSLLGIASVLVIAVAWFAWRTVAASTLFGGVDPEVSLATKQVGTLHSLASLVPVGARSSAASPEDAKAVAADSVRCLVQDAEGRPRSGVSVFLLQPLDESQTDLERIDPEKSASAIERRTSSEGRVEFPVASRHRAYVIAMVDMEGLVARAWIGDAREITLSFPRIVDGFEVEVVTQAGLPVLEYALSLGVRKSNSVTALGDHEVHSLDGRFRTSIRRPIGPGQRLVVRVRPPVELEEATAEYSRGQALEDVAHRIVVVEKVGGLRGLVVRADGAPVAEADVRWAPVREQDQCISTRSDARGVFVLGRDVVAGTGFLSVQTWERAPYLRPLADVPVSTTGELRVVLEPGSTIEGLVLSDGVPVPDARVLAWIASDWPHGLGLGAHWWAEAVADAQGHYRLTDVPLGLLQLSVDPRPPKEREGSLNCGAGTLEVVDARQEHDITVSRGVRLHGEFDIDMPANAALFLQVLDARDPSVQVSTGTCTAGEEFELEAPRSRASTLRIWVNTQAMYDVPIPASSEAIDLGEVELRMKKFRALDAR